MVVAANSFVGVYNSGLFSNALIFQKEKLICILDFSLSKLMFVHLTEKRCPQQQGFLVISGQRPLCGWLGIKAADW